MVFEEFDPRIRVIFTADNFGQSREANQAVIRAHREGVLTCASLPVRGAAIDEAVALVLANPGLEVGLQLVLVGGKSVLKPSEIVGLVDERFGFGDRFWTTVLRYELIPRLKGPLQAEVDAQIRLFRRKGLPLGFLAGRAGLHLHPTICQMIRRYHEAWGIRAVRATRDPILTNLRLEFSRTWRRLPRGLLMRSFDRKARPLMVRRGLGMTDYVLGHMAENRLDLDYLLHLFSELPSGTYEICLNPDEEEHADELAALLSPELKGLMHQRGMELIRHADLIPEPKSAPQAKRAA